MKTGTEDCLLGRFDTLRRLTSYKHTDWNRAMRTAAVRKWRKVSINTGMPSYDQNYVEPQIHTAPVLHLLDLVIWADDRVNAINTKQRTYPIQPFHWSKSTLLYTLGRETKRRNLRVQSRHNSSKVQSTKQLRSTWSQMRACYTLYVWGDIKI